MAVQAPARRDDAMIIRDPGESAASKLEKVLITGDLAALTPDQRVFYYREVCDSVGLNPLTRPFDYLSLNGKLVLYANRSCTDQVRRINAIEVTKLERDRDAEFGLAIVTAYGRDRTGRQDSAIGAVNIKNLQGEALANALMKAETKAKRRLTLSMSGLGLLDEIEVESIPGAWREAVDPTTGEITTPKDLASRLAEQAAAIEAQSEGGSEPDSGAPVAAAPGASSAGASTPAAAAPNQETAAPAVASTVAEATEPEAPGAEAILAEPVVGSGADAPGVTAGELRDWLREHVIGITDALKVARAKWGDGMKTLDSLTDQQRAELKEALA